MSLIRRLGFAYFALFVIVGAMGYAPRFSQVLDLDLMGHILANRPHLPIGGLAYAGFMLSRRHGEPA